MIKKFMTLGLALIATIGFTAMAQAPQKGEGHKCCDKPGKEIKAGDQNKMYTPQNFTDYAMEGILLDVNQQARVDSLNAAMSINGKECAGKPEQGCAKADKECPKDQKCEGKECHKDQKCEGKECHKDGAKCKKGMHSRNPQARRAEYIAKMKEILTPEQYTQFLENIAKAPVQHPKHRNTEGRPGMKKGAQKVEGCQKAAGECQKAEGCQKAQDCQKANGAKKVDGAKPAKGMKAKKEVKQSK